MSLIPQKSAAEICRDIRIAGVLATLEACNHLAAIQTNGNAAYWNQEPAVLIEDLNADVAGALSLFASNTALAELINANLDANPATNEDGTPTFRNRAPAEIGRRGISFDATAGQFIYIAPPEPESGGESA